MDSGLPRWHSWLRICLQCRRPGFDSWVEKIHWRRDRLPILVFLGFLCGSAGKESTCSVGDLVSIPGLGRSPGEGQGYPLQYSGLEKSMDYIKSVRSQKVRHNWATFTHLGPLCIQLSKRCPELGLGHLTNLLSGYPDCVHLGPPCTFPTMPLFSCQPTDVWNCNEGGQLYLLIFLFYLLIFLFFIQFYMLHTTYNYYKIVTMFLMLQNPSLSLSYTP